MPRWTERPATADEIRLAGLDNVEGLHASSGGDASSGSSTNTAPASGVRNRDQVERIAYRLALGHKS